MITETVKTLSLCAMAIERIISNVSSNSDYRQHRSVSVRYSLLAQSDLFQYSTHSRYRWKSQPPFRRIACVTTEKRLLRSSGSSWHLPPVSPSYGRPAFRTTRRAAFRRPATKFDCFIRRDFVRGLVCPSGQIQISRRRWRTRQG